MPDARVAEKPLDADAMRAANAAVHPETGGRPIRSDETDLRRKWMDAYAAAGGRVKERTPRRRRADDACESCPKVPITLEIVEIEYLSDHDTVKNQDDFWPNDGTKFDPPDWTPSHQNPLTHSMHERIELRVKVKVGPDGAAPESGRLVGRMADKVAFDTGRVTFKPGSEQEFTLRSRHRVKALIREQEFKIEWQAVSARTMLSWATIGTTNNDRVYITLDTPIETGETREDGVTLQRMTVAVDWLGAAGSVSHVAMLDETFGLYDTYILASWDAARENVVGSTLPASMIKELDEDPKLKKELADADWPTFFNDDAGAWPAVEFLDWGAECQAICRLVRGMLRQVGSRKNIKLVYVTADFSKPNRPLYSGISKNPRTGERQRFEPTGPRADHEYALVDRPIELKTYWAPKKGQPREVGWNNFEAYLRYRYTYKGKTRTRWWGGGVGRIAPGSNPLHVFHALVEYKDVSRIVKEGDDEREDWGRLVTRIHKYRTF